jgi:5-methylcytosine-specific restriction endonuclease McrA
LKRERQKAQKLRKSQWWLALLQKGLCHYCRETFPASRLTMDHVVPLARGGTSTPGNLVPACAKCNRDKKLGTPLDEAFAELRAEGSPEEKEDPESSD